jgi:hypothetical protein
MKILPQKDAMDGFFAVVLKKKWLFVFFKNLFIYVYSNSNLNLNLNII